MRAPVLSGLVVLVAACGDSISPGLASLDVLPAVHFPALGDTVRLTVTATDPEGLPVLPALFQFQSRDPSVASVDASGKVESTGDGATFVIVRFGALAESTAVSVTQARDSLVLGLLVSDPIVSLPGGVPFPLSCRAFDAGGNLLALSNTVVSRTGTVAGASCGTLTAEMSGHDTLVVTAGSYQATLSVVVAIRPTLLSDPAIPLMVDSLPGGSSPWAPTLVRNSGGSLDLYFAAYQDAADQLGGKRGDLHRLTSNDGLQFQYSGIVLHRDPFPCSPRGTGIENVAIVPRAEGPGWRMFYSAGSDDCYGWQVFSALSSDELEWTPEPGVRISNGGALTPVNRVLPPWPAGEGMNLEQLPSGEWRMLVGAYARQAVRENRFQVTEWRSADQVRWTYGGTVLRTRDVGPEARRSVYSPVVTDLAPGLKRMYFTGDNLDVAGGHSRIYSAVSVDGDRWQVEGAILGGGGADYFYSTMVDDLLVFIRSVSGIHTLGSVRIGTL